MKEVFKGSNLEDQTVRQLLSVEQGKEFERLNKEEFEKQYFLARVDLITAVNAIRNVAGINTGKKKTFETLGFKPSDLYSALFIMETTAPILGIKDPENYAFLYVCASTIATVTGPIRVEGSVKMNFGALAARYQDNLNALTQAKQA